MRLAFRGYLNGHLVFEERIEIDPDALDDLVADLGFKHASALAHHNLHMIEIEFLDESDPLQRYFRFGTDPGGMVQPMEIKL